MAEKETIKRIHEGHNDANFDLLAKSVLLSGKSVTEAVENLTSAETDLSDIRARLEELQKEIDALETGESGESVDISEIKAEIEALTARVAALETGETGESEELTELKAQLEAVSESITNLSTNLSTLTSRVSNLQTDVGNINSIAEQARDDASTAVTEIENVQGIAEDALNVAYDTASDINNIKNTVDMLLSSGYKVFYTMSTTSRVTEQFKYEEYGMLGELRLFRFTDVFDALDGVQTLVNDAVNSAGDVNTDECYVGINIITTNPISFGKTNDFCYVRLKSISFSTTSNSLSAQPQAQPIWYTYQDIIDGTASCWVRYYTFEIADGSITGGSSGSDSLYVGITLLYKKED